MSNKPADPLMGLKSFAIAGPMVQQRARCLGMTDEERRWRAQFLKDQILSHDEPKDVPALYRDTTNVFRRLWKTPLWKFQKYLEPKVGPDFAFLFRHLLGKGALTIACGYALVYYLKYHTNDFTVSRTIELHVARPVMYPDHPNYPNYPERKPSEYYDLGFYSSVLARKVN